MYLSHLGYTTFMIVVCDHSFSLVSNYHAPPSFWIEGTSDHEYFTQNEATLPNLPAVQAPTTKYYPQSVSIIIIHEYFVPPKITWYNVNLQNNYFIYTAHSHKDTK